MISVPDALVASLVACGGPAGRDFAATLPALVAERVAGWGLRVDGTPMHGIGALVLPVVRQSDDVPAVLKLQLVDEETEGEPVALRVWAGDGAVRLLGHDPGSGSMLLERLDASRTPHRVADSRDAVLVLARLLARLTARPAPGGLRRLGDIARRMLERTPAVRARIPDPGVRRLVGDCAAAVREVAGEPGDRLLHWDLHYGNVLGADRADWVAIDPKPLAGDPGFELLPALVNRYDPGETRWRFDAMTGVLGLDRERARAWTLGRVLQNCLWEVESGNPPGGAGLEIARLLLSPGGPGG